MRPAPPEWAPGVDIGRYTLLARIAMGGMAEIWLARQTGARGFEKLVVVKRIRDHLGHTDDFIEMFLDEARIAAELNHPGIVQIFDLGSYGGAYFIAMEYLCGEPLNKVIGYRKTDKPLPIPLAVKLVAQAAEALAYAHSRVGPDGRPLGIVHRDISPPNLFVTYDGTLKILDFGIAKASNRTNETQLGKIKGKLAYMAPEQARAGPLDHRADLFALGIVLWEALARSRFVVSDDPVRMMAFIIGKEAFPSPATKNPEVPADLAAIVARALSRDPAHRFQNGTQFQLALERWLKVHEFAPTSAHIARHMRTVFAQNVASAQALIESVRTGDVSKLKPPRIAPLIALKPVASQTPSAAHTPPALHPPRALHAPSTLRTPPALHTPFEAQTPRPVPETLSEPPLPLATHTPLPPQTPSAAEVPLALQTALPLQMSLELQTLLEPPTALPDPHAPPPAQTSPAAPASRQTQGPLKSDDPRRPIASPAGARRFGVKRGLAGAFVATALFGAIGFAAVRSSVKPAVAVKLEPVAMQSVEVVPRPPPVEIVVGSVSVEQPQQTAQLSEESAQLHVVPAKGRLSIVTKPWSEVFLGKKKLGETPLLNVPLAAGRYNLRLINPDTGREKTVPIEVRGQQTTTVKERL